MTGSSNDGAGYVSQPAQNSRTKECIQVGDINQSIVHNQSKAGQDDMLVIDGSEQPSSGIEICNGDKDDNSMILARDSTDSQGQTCNEFDDLLSSDQSTAVNSGLDSVLDSSSENIQASKVLRFDEV